MEAKLLLVIGEENKENGDFLFKRKSFQYVSDILVDFDKISSDMRSGGRDMFFKFLESVDDVGKTIIKLGIFLEEGARFPKKVETRMRLLTLIFSGIEMIPFKLCSDQLNQTKENSKYVTSKLYDLLQRNIQQNNDSNVIDVINSSFMFAFKPYQIKSVLWLVDREMNRAYLSEEFFPIICKSNGKTFYINSRNLEIQYNKPEPYPIPPGGILADEMGLGKTLEMLALIIYNKRTNVSDHSTIKTSEDDIDSAPQKKPKQENKLFCICSNSEETDLIQCAECYLYQHKECVRKYTKIEDQMYLCPKCWSNISEPIQSGTTIIITPHPIKMQWFSEIKKHVKCELSVFLYEGVSEGWISPIELAAYDIVLTDYNILRKEIHYSPENETQIEFRYRQDRARVCSPLVLVEWWRVCLDEGQMVESTQVNTAKMVKSLPAINRWAISGTPINKTIDDLYGLIYFLNLEPLCKQHVWESLVQEFLAGETEKFVDIFQQIMWRTSKSSVVDELNIPEQKEEVHFIEMSDAQKFFYKDQHSEKAKLFQEKINKMLSSCHTKISQIDPRELNNILEPLKKLRQDCTIPVLTKKNEHRYQKLLEPKELMAHLILTNENECRSSLRTLASAYNGLSGIYLIQQKYEKAISIYEKVLKLAAESVENVNVDSLLQIHALHNCIMAQENLNRTFDKDPYIKQLASFENKYLLPYSNNLINCEAELVKIQESVHEFFNVHHAGELPKIWRVIYNNLDNIEIPRDYLSRIYEIQFINDIPKSGELFTFKRGIRMTECWFKELLNKRTTVQNYFQMFDMIYQNVKSKEKLQPELIVFLNETIKEMLECHLIRENSLKTIKNYKLNLCRICKGKEIFDHYECHLFRKHIGGHNEVEGTWHASYNEEIMKFMLISFRKKAPLLYRQNMTKPLELLNVLKSEFKVMTKLWVELDYTLKAYDELEMCKLRLQLVAAGEPVKSAHQISEETMNIAEFTTLVKSAEENFYRASSRLNYIKRLNINENPGPCPICQHEIFFKYSVWQCGHHLCCECMDSMVKHSNRSRQPFACPICRHEQTFTEIHTVHLNAKAANDNLVKGQFSGKVQEIVQTVLKLKEEDNSVKIIVFSHWDSILVAISRAFNENGIENRVKWSPKSLEEFKDDTLNITCMLLLLTNGAKGLNLTEATHVFFVEPLLNPGEEAQAIGRIHRMGQTKPTTVHRFIVKGTIEEQIYKGITSKESKWDWNELTIEKIQSLFSLPSEEGEDLSR